MAVLWMNGRVFERSAYDSEKDLEAAIVEVQHQLFGQQRFYFDIKKKIDKNIPDGYLIDLSTRQPRLYVVENELAAHDPLRHIAPQIANFAASFKRESRTVQRILLEAIQRATPINAAFERFIQANGFRNLDHLLDEMVHSNPFAALIIIDEVPERLSENLASLFKFGVEIIELQRFQDDAGNRVYSFEPFSLTVGSEEETGLLPLGSPELDTVIVPARKEGFEETFIGENRWYSIRMGVLRPQIKYIAVYQVAPVSAITHVAPVRSIEPWGSSNKFVVNFAEAAKKIGPIGRGQRLRHLQNLIYTSYDRLRSARTLDDL